ncbi:PLP-dependent aminotransferase family protein [Mumia sp.]|uniref:MocR-like transcription factor YczR n=1 Tax=Mumia sp. TaxID=1965300 RepID=UPI00262EB5F8|nr:PLP-dependent aminotransferase family protein [Mumia sp.]MDD9347995.1 PLP-dependent aminotransferase family protein [Mumia sp.]
MAPTSVLSAERLHVLLDIEADDPTGYRELADLIRLLVLDGRRPAGTRLPSERELTAALPLSRTTVTRAYAVLRDAELLVSRRGSGSVVTLPRGARPPYTPPSGSSMVGWTIAAGQAAPGVGLAYSRALEQLPAYLAQTGYETVGVPVLRELVAQRYADRGLPTDPDQILVTSGAQSALNLVSRTLAARGDRVVVESPTYPNAIDSLRRTGLRVLGVPHDGHRLDLDALAAAVRAAPVAWAYLIPDFQNPTGALMDDIMRHEVASILRRSTTVPIVDETMLDLALDVEERAMPVPLAAHHPGAITLGSASKSFWGGLRIGWIRAPHAVVPRLVAARETFDIGTPVLEQLAVAELLRVREEVLDERRDTLRARRSALRTAVTARLPDWSLNSPAGGLSLWVRLPRRASSRLVVAAEAQDLLLTAGPRFYADGGGESALRLPYDRSTGAIDDAVDRLALAWETVLAGRPTSAPSRRGPALTA